MKPPRAFTLLELLVVIALIGVLAALLLPALSAAKGHAKRATCLSHLRQVNLGLRMYCDDSSDKTPMVNGAAFWTTAWSSYRRLIKDYVGAPGQPSPRDKLFACPADTFYYDLRPEPHPSIKGLCGLWPIHASLWQQTNFDYSSYAFNAGISNVFSRYTNSIGLTGRKLSSIQDPVKTVLVCEVPAFFPYSWHQPGRPSTFGAMTFAHGATLFLDARNMVGFVDGHVSYIKIFWDPGPVQPGLWATAMQYNPPPGYDYKWSGD